MGNSTHNVAIEMTTGTVQESEVERFRLVARDGHIDVDMMTLESLQIQPYQARDGEALAEQIEISQMTFLLYLTALFGLIFGTIMLGIYRQEMNSRKWRKFSDGIQGEEQTALVEAALEASFTSSASTWNFYISSTTSTWNIYIFTSASSLKQPVAPPLLLN